MSSSSDRYQNFQPECPQIPDVVLNDPANKQMKVIIIGAGLGGILHSYNIDKSCSNVEYVVYEKNADIGAHGLRIVTLGALVIYPVMRIRIILHPTYVHSNRAP